MCFFSIAVLPLDVRQYASRGKNGDSASECDSPNQSNTNSPKNSGLWKFGPGVPTGDQEA